MSCLSLVIYRFLYFCGFLCLTLWFTSTIWREICPEDGVVNVAASIKLKGRLESNLCCHVS